MNNVLILFLRETLQRLLTKQPKYFKVISTVSAVLVAVTGIPEALQYFGIDLPTIWDEHINRIVGVASTAAFIISSLTAQNPTVGVGTDGSIIKKVDEKKLPFTAKTEAPKE